MPERKSKSYPKLQAARKAVREAAARSVPASDLRRATLFMNGRSQAVRLPKEFRFEGTHVYVRKEGNRVILSPEDDRWERFLAAFGSAPGFPDRDQGTPQERPELNAWADAAD
jgi:antitoxin VapB